MTIRVGPVVLPLLQLVTARQAPIGHEAFQRRQPVLVIMRPIIRLAAIGGDTAGLMQQVKGAKKS